MDNRVAGCQPPAGATPLLRFGLPSPPGVVLPPPTPQGTAPWPKSDDGVHPVNIDDNSFSMAIYEHMSAPHRETSLAYCA